MANKKSELYSLLWSSYDELRGGMDASQYKDYVLVMLFIKYVSELLWTQNLCLFDQFQYFVCVSGQDHYKLN